jgi:hypothetical protein
MITNHGKLITISCLLVGIWGSSRICRAERHQEKNSRANREGKDRTESKSHSRTWLGRTHAANYINTTSNTKL